MFASMLAAAMYPTSKSTSKFNGVTIKSSPDETECHYMHSGPFNCEVTDSVDNHGDSRLGT